MAAYMKPLGRVMVWLFFIFIGGLIPAVAFSQAYGDFYARNGFHSGSHGWRGPIGSRYIIVDKSGKEDFVYVQDAVDSVMDRNREQVTIEIRPGIYLEKVLVPITKPYITFQGWGKERTSIEWHNKASDVGPDGQELHTYNTASVTVLASHFTAKNISFKVQSRFRDTANVLVEFCRILFNASSVFKRQQIDNVILE